MTDAVETDNQAYQLVQQGRLINLALDQAYREGDDERAKLLLQAAQDNAAALAEAPPVPLPSAIDEPPPVPSGDEAPPASQAVQG